MNNKKNYNPDVAIHPGVTLKETVDALNMPQKELSIRTNLTEKVISEIVQRKNPITPETAIKLERVLGISATFWNNLQRKYEETLAKKQAFDEIKQELAIVETYDCYKEMADKEWVPIAKNKTEKAFNLLNFFGVDSLKLVPEIHGIAFRKQLKKEISKTALAAWIRKGEIEANKITTSEFNKDLLQNKVKILRTLTVKRPSEYGPQIRQHLAECGIAVVYIPSLSRTYVNGFTRWLSSSRVMIELSLFNKSSDILWFTLFHEIGHVLNHSKKEKYINLELNGELQENDIEKEANEFARDILIPPLYYDNFIKSGNFSNNAISNFAESINLDRGIVAGRLAYEKYITWKEISHLRSWLQFRTN